MKHTKKYIIEHYEGDGQLSIDDLPFTDENVDNSLTDVDKCENAVCDICPDFECVHCKNEEAINASIEAYDVPFIKTDFEFECDFEIHA